MLKAGVNMTAVFWLGILVSGHNANIPFTFQAVKNLSPHPTYLCFGLFLKFFGVFIWR